MEIKKSELYFKNKHTAVEHLSDDELYVLTTRYYKEKNAKLLEEYNIELPFSVSLHSLLPLRIIEKCPVCEKGTILNKLPYKNNYLHDFTPFCSNCEHTYSYECTCDFCIEERKIKKTNTINSIIDYFNAVTPVSETDLTFKEKLYLSTLMRMCMSENLSYIKPLSCFNEKLTPVEDCNIMILKELYNKNLIKPLFMDDLDNYLPNENGSFAFYLLDVSYRLNITPFDSDYKAMVKRLLYPDADYFLLIPEFLTAFWKQIICYEAIECLFYRLEKIGCHDKKIEDKTMVMFMQLAEDLSGEELQYITFTAINATARMILENKISKNEAKDIAISRCQYYGEKAIAENWDIKSRRELPQSIISQVFFNYILKIGDAGFKARIPSLDSFWQYIDNKIDNQEEI